MTQKKYRYGKPVKTEEIPKTRRLPEYDECLKEFLESGAKIWMVNKEAMPSKKTKVILSSLKWRVDNKPEFKHIRVFVRKYRIYLERVNHEEK